MLAQNKLGNLIKSIRSQQVVAGTGAEQLLESYFDTCDEHRLDPCQRRFDRCLYGEYGNGSQWCSILRKFTCDPVSGECGKGCWIRARSQVTVER